MMPLAFVAQPDDPELRACIAKYRKAKPATAWSAFRADGHCGPRAVAHLQTGYGPRCVYCDHAHGWTIDHVTAKAGSRSKQFQWANWRPSCMDCNNKKGRKRVVDPVRKDPRSYVGIDLTTGQPVVVATKATAVAEATRALLDNQTLNEARRVARARFVELLDALVAGRTAAKKTVRAALLRATPHRAVIRELILEQDSVLNPYRSTVEKALAILPELAAWALDPAEWHP